MTNHFFLFFSIIFSYEIIKIFNIINIIKINLKTSKNIFKLFKSSDDYDLDNEKLILNYSKIMLLNSLKLFAVIILIVGKIFFLNILSNTFINFLTSIYGILIAIFFTFFYIFFKKKLNG